jgi:hypothetical protein
MIARKRTLVVGIVAISLGTERIAECRAYSLIRAAVEMDSPDDPELETGRKREKSENREMDARLRVHYLNPAQNSRPAADRLWLMVEPDSEPPQPRVRFISW